MGDFLPGFFLEDSQAFDEWLMLKREGLQRQALEVFSRLATYHEMRAEYETLKATAWGGGSCGRC